MHNVAKWRAPTPAWRRVVRRRRDHVEQVGRGLVVVLEDAVALALRAGDGPQLDDLTLGPLAAAVPTTMLCVLALILYFPILRYDTELWNY